MARRMLAFVSVCLCAAIPTLAVAESGAATPGAGDSQESWEVEQPEPETDAWTWPVVVETGLLYVYGNKLDPPYVFDFRDSTLSVNGVQINPRLRREREKPGPAPAWAKDQHSLVVQALDSVEVLKKQDLSRDSVVAEAARIFRESELVDWVDIEGTGLAVHWAGLHARLLVPLYRDGFELPPPPSREDSNRNIVRRLEMSLKPGKVSFYGTAKLFNMDQAEAAAAIRLLERTRDPNAEDLGLLQGPAAQDLLDPLPIEQTCDQGPKAEHATFNGEPEDNPEQCENQVELMLSTWKSVYVLGEPVLMRASVHNAGDEPERVLLMFDDSEHRLKFHFRNEKGEVYSRGTGVHVDIVGEVRELHGFPLGPGETRYGYRTAYRGRTPRGGFVFPEAGQYDIWWEFKGWKRPLTSNTVRITLRDPVGVDAEAFETFTNKSTSMLVGTESRTFLLQERKAEALNSWRMTLEKWPGSTYAPYALFFLASYERWHGDPRKALKLYEGLLNAYEPFAYTEAAEFYMLDCYRELGADDLARNMLIELASKYPGSDLANPIQIGPQTPQWELRQATIEGR